MIFYCRLVESSDSEESSGSEPEFFLPDGHRATSDKTVAEVIFESDAFDRIRRSIITFKYITYHR